MSENFENNDINVEQSNILKDANILYNDFKQQNPIEWQLIAEIWKNTNFISYFSKTIESITIRGNTKSKLSDFKTNLPTNIV
jgi:hypothetical protein